MFGTWQPLGAGTVWYGMVWMVRYEDIDYQRHRDDKDATYTAIAFYFGILDFGFWIKVMILSVWGALQ